MGTYDPLYPANDSPVDKTSEYLRTKCEQLRTGQIVDAKSIMGTPLSSLALKSDIIASAGKSSADAWGDSLTAGVPFTDNSPTDDIDVYSWTNTVRKTLGITVHNYGVGGQTSTEILARFDSDTKPSKPSHCIIMWGVNDAWKPEKGVSFAQTQANTIEIVRRCRSAGIVPVFGLFTPLELTGDTLKIQKCNEIRSWIFGYCQSNKVAMIDFYSYTVNNVSNAPIGSYFGADGIHLNQLGYTVMGNVACQFLKDILPEFTGTRSPLENMIGTYAAGQSPHITYPTGFLDIDSAPVLGNALLWTNLGSTWAVGGYVRDAKSPPTNNVSTVTTATPDKYWEKGDVFFDITSSTEATLYIVDKSGYSKSHAIVAEQGTFVALATFLLKGSVPQSYLDSYASPNTTRKYNGGDTIRYTSPPCAYMALTDGYHNTSPLSPRAQWLQIG